MTAPMPIITCTISSNLNALNNACATLAALPPFKTSYEVAYMNPETFDYFVRDYPHVITPEFQVETALGGLIQLKANDLVPEDIIKLEVAL